MKVSLANPSLAISYLFHRSERQKLALMIAYLTGLPAGAVVKEIEPAAETAESILENFNDKFSTASFLREKNE